MDESLLKFQQFGVACENKGCKKVWDTEQIEMWKWNEMELWDFFIYKREKHSPPIVTLRSLSSNTDLCECKWF